MLRLLWIIPGVAAAYILLLCVSALLADPRRKYDKNSRFYRWLLNSATACCLFIMRIRVKTGGLTKLPEGRFLLVCNHRSNFDPIISWYVLRKYELAFVSKAENFKIPVFGRLIRRCCFMAIDRENPRRAMAAINRAAGLIESGEVSVAVYPEGTRSRSGELLPFHNGVLKIAQKAGAPVVIATIQGTERIARNFPLRASYVKFDILDVIPAGYAAEHRTSELGADIRQAMLDNIQRGDNIG
mgnify:CR=1 FL=1